MKLSNERYRDLIKTRQLHTGLRSGSFLDCQQIVPGINIMGLYGQRVPLMGAMIVDLDPHAFQWALRQRQRHDHAFGHTNPRTWNVLKLMSFQRLGCRGNEDGAECPVLWVFSGGDVKSSPIEIHVTVLI